MVVDVALRIQTRRSQREANATQELGAADGAER
jgi:hypothetical protein